MDYNCPKRPERQTRILFWKLNVPMPHEWKIIDIGVHMIGVNNSFKVEKECIHCGKWKKESFVEHEELMALGFSKEEIKKARFHKL